MSRNPAAAIVCRGLSETVAQAQMREHGKARTHSVSLEPGRVVAATRDGRVDLMLLDR